jgi:proline iminopeptidase
MKIDIGGLKLYVDIDGFALMPDGPRIKERPTVLLVHGGPGFDHTIQKRFAPKLAAFAQTICYDQRGHGRSDHATAESWNLAHWADDIPRLCDALCIEKPIVLGSSFGGIVAQAYAIRHPGHPGKLILHSTTPHFRLDRIVRKFEELGGRRARAAADALWRDPGDPALLGPYTEICMPLYNTTRRNPALTRDWGIASPDVLTHFYSHGGEGHRFDFRDQLSRIACPTLVMAGTEDPICPIDDALDIVAGLRPDITTFRQFENCGHGINWDDPDAFLATVRDFVLQ